METSRITDVSPQRAHDSDRDPLAPDRENPKAILSSRSPPTNDRLSAVPSSGMVRDPNSIDLNKEETRPKRASSIGASIRRLFSSSPAPQERSSSETNTSGTVVGAGKRGRTPPKNTNSPNQISTDSIESSTIPPNNLYFVPKANQRANTEHYMGGKRGQSEHSSRAMASSHRGFGALHANSLVGYLHPVDQVLMRRKALLSVNFQ